MIRHVPLGQTHLGRIAALNQLSREICSHECSLKDAWTELNRSANERVFNLDLDNSAVLIHRYREGFFGENKTCRGFDFTDDPVAERNLGKRKAAVLCGGGSHQA